MVKSKPAGDLLHVCPDFLAQIGDLINESDFRRQECVSSVLNELRSPSRGEEKGSLIEVERAVELFHQFSRSIIAHPNYDPVRVLEVSNSRALAEELWVGNDCHIRLRMHHVNQFFDLISGPNWHSRLSHD